MSCKGQVWGRGARRGCGWRRPAVGCIGPTLPPHIAHGIRRCLPLQPPIAGPPSPYATSGGGGAAAWRAKLGGRALQCAHVRLMGVPPFVLPGA